jgi:hypothetical protein
VRLVLRAFASSPSWLAAASSEVLMILGSAVEVVLLVVVVVVVGCVVVVIVEATGFVTRREGRRLRRCCASASRQHKLMIDMTIRTNVIRRTIRTRITNPPVSLSKRLYTFRDAASIIVAAAHPALTRRAAPQVHLSDDVPVSLSALTARRNRRVSSDGTAHPP